MKKHSLSSLGGGSLAALLGLSYSFFAAAQDPPPAQKDQVTQTLTIDGTTRAQVRLAFPKTVFD